MHKLEKILYTATATSTEGPDARVTATSPKLDLKLSLPKEFGGAGGEGTNPEQLFAAAYSTCFLGALKHIAFKEKVFFPIDASIMAQIDVGPISGGFALAATLNISLPEMDKDVAHALIEKAHWFCPFSNATRGNIEVTLNLIE